MRLKKIIKNAERFLSLKIILPAVYAIAARRPLQRDLAVFVEVSADHLTDSFELLYDGARRRGLRVRLVCIHDGSVPGVQYLKNCMHMLRAIATARLVFLNEASNVISCVHLRSSTRLIQTWHACGAFKKFGFSTGNLPWGVSEREMERYPYYRNQWLVSVSSPEAVAAYQDAMRQPPGVIRPLGVSRTDVFFDEKYIGDSREMFLENFPRARGKKVILFAPTFRGTQTGARSIELDHAAFFAALSDKYVLVEKHHPFVKSRPGIPGEYADFARDLTDGMEISRLLCVADICVSDYSSLIFEYSLFERPMLFYAPDLDDYFDDRGFYYDYGAFTPGPVYADQESLIEGLAKVDEWFDKRRVAAFKERFMSSCDGRSTERILDAALY